MITDRQRFWLQKAWNEGSLIVGGIDASKPTPRMDIIVRLCKLGYLRWRPSGLFANSFVLTDAGKSLFEKEKD